MKASGLAFGVAALVSTLFSARALTIPDQIDAILARPAVVTNTWSILIENSTGSTIYYQRNPTSGLAPASNTKIFTSSAAFGLLGTNYAFQTRIYTNGTLAAGVLTGDLNLVCEHDITWNTDVFANPRAPLDYIATKLKAMGITNITGNAQCYGCCFYNLGSTDASNHDASNQLPYNRTAATNFVAALNAQGITVAGIPTGQSGFAPSGSLCYAYYSTNLTFNATPLRLDIACNPMLKESHNVMADALCRHLGYKIGGTDSFAAGALQVLKWMNNSAGVPTNGIVMNDGSGLSHGNKFTARETVSLIRYMLAAFPSWPTCLPIGCNSPGTLSGRFCSTDGSVKVHAKTGSLSISIALSGYIDNKYDNQRYLFSFIANVAGIDQTDTRQAIDDAVVLLGTNGFPLSPQLRQVKSGSNGTSLNLAWSDEKFIRTGYRIYSSSDGVSFGSPISVGSGVQAFTDPGLAPGTKRYYKVSVVGTGGESKASRIYGAQVGGAARVLIVDGNDRWQTQTTENPSCTNHGFCAIVGQNVSGPVFETVNHQAIIDGAISLTNYAAVVWLFGEESTVNDTFSPIEQTFVTSYLNAGGNLFVSGAELGWDLDRTGTGPTTADRDFYHNQLRAVFAIDDANTYAFAPLAGGIFAGNAGSGFDNGTKGTYNVDFPDVLTATNGGVTAINSTGGTGGAGAIQYDGSLGGGKVVNFGFPFETITNSATRDAYLSDVLRFFGVLEPPTLKVPQWNLTNNNLTLSWNASAGLTYRVQFKTNLNDVLWQTLGTDVTATSTTCSKLDNSSPGDPQRFYRISLVN
jgi:D-alanyl-D-alanine carboxypeptidase